MSAAVGNPELACTAEGTVQPQRDRSRERFALLLPLRGLLAVGVVVHHIPGIEMNYRFARVVAFFLISGYCIFAAAQRSLESPRQAPWTFLRRRFLRLLPPVIAAMAYLFALSWLFGITAAAARTKQDALAWIQNLTCTQWLSTIGLSTLPPWQNPRVMLRPHWSLEYELQFYLVMAVLIFATRRSTFRLWWAAAAMVAIGAAFNLALPARWTSTFIDYAVYFGLGGLVWATCTNAAPRWVLPALVASVIGIGASAWIASQGAASADALLDARASDAYDALLVGCAGTLVLLIAYRADRFWKSVKFAAPLNALGTISYSLFLVHAINTPLARRWTENALPADPPGWLWVVVFVAIQIALAVPFWYLFERPFTGRRRVQLAAANAGTASPTLCPV